MKSHKFTNKQLFTIKGSLTIKLFEMKDLKLG